MPNSVLTPSVIAKEALMLLDNNLVLGNLVNRAYEDEMQKPVNGYKKGGSVQIRRPAKYAWRAGAVASPQDTTEKSLTLSVDTQGGVDLAFSSADMTLKIGDFSERFLKPAMITIANQIDRDIAGLYNTVWNWIGTPGQTIDAFADFGKAPQRLTEMAVPEDRCGVLSPADKWGLLGALTSSFVQGISKPAIERARLPLVGGVDLYETQNVRTHTVGTKAGTPLVNGGSQATTYAASGATNAQSLVTDGWSISSAVLKQGDVFTIAGVFAVNPVSKDVMPYLQQFVVNADASSDGTYGVNSGIARSGKVLRRVLGVPSNDWRVTAEVLGPLAKRDPKAVVAAINDERLRFLQSLKTWPVFGAGWGRRVKEVRAFSLALAACSPAGIPLAPEKSSAPGKGHVSANAGMQGATAGGAVVAGGTAANQAQQSGADPATIAIIVVVTLAVAGAAWFAFRWWRKREQERPIPGTPTVPKIAE